VLNGTIPWPSPAVLGHEGAGVLAEAGTEVKKVKPGDHVVVATLANCGLCEWCNTGHPTWCRRSLGTISQPFTYKGQPAANVAATSSFAELTVVSETQAVPISKDVPLTSACLIACGVLTGVGAVLNRARVSYGQTAAVFGVGGVGLNVIQGLRLANASRIFAIDTVATKESLARHFGATDFIDATSTDTVAAIKGAAAAGPMNSGGVDWSFECVGHAGVLRTSIDVLDWGARAWPSECPLPASRSACRSPTWSMSTGPSWAVDMGRPAPTTTIPMLVGLYLDGKLMLDELVSQTYPLDQFDAVTHDMHDGKLARGVLTF
jgi:Zn-dependent alcohol dehydrogenase